MADDKNFDATPSRVARARREGDVPRSSDAVAVTSFAAAVLAAAGALPGLGAAAAGAFVAATAGRVALAAYATIALDVLGVVVAALAGAVFATYAQTRTFVFVMPSVKVRKLDPIAGLKRMFGREALVGVAKAALVSAAVTLALVPVVRDDFAASVATLVPAALALHARYALGSALATAIAVGGGFAALDVLVEREKWRRRLRMSFDEVKRDHKQSDGDPHVRGRRRRLHQAMARGSIVRVREAAFVVTNPTHVAVALAYDPPRVAVPCVLVRAVDAVAAEVRAEARRHGIPLVEDVALARALYAATEVGDAIPRESYLAVAQIVASLTRLQRASAP